MSFFGTPLNKLTFDDLDELVKTKAKENVRLEFKQGDPGKENYLKKLSSFANTSGGYLILGMKEGADHRAEELVGVPALPSFEAQVSSWCAQNIYPPIIPTVSNPIEIPGKGTYAYVIYVDESELAPHFIEGRQGCFIRTNETSHHFEPEFATLAEIQALINRREQARLTLQLLKDRSEERIRDRESKLMQSRPTGPFMPLTISVRPSFPRKPLVPLGDLLDLMKSSVVHAGGIKHFPNLGMDIYSQADSLIVPSARHPRLSFVEVTRYGTTTYTEFFECHQMSLSGHQGDDSPTVKWGLSMSKVLGAIFLGLKFGLNFASAAGAFGTLEIRADLRSKAEVTGCMFDQAGDPYHMGILQFDERIVVTRELHVEEFRAGWKDQAEQIWREIYFSLGWQVSFADVGSENLEVARREALRWIPIDSSFLTS